MDRAETSPPAARGTLPLRLYFFASFAALGVFSPFFPRWLVARGIEGISLGAVAATMPAMGVLGPPLVGFLADSLGLRGSLLRVACLGSLVAFVLLAAAGIGHYRLSFAEILAVVLLFAVFRAPMLLMADVVAVEGERDGGASYGTTRLWGSCGFLVASVAGGRYLDPESATALPALVAVSLSLALVTALGIPLRSSAVRASRSSELRSLIGAEDFTLLLAAAFVAESAISCHELCFSLYLSDLGASTTLIGAAWGLGVFVEILVMAAAGPLIARFGAPLLVVLALAATAVRCAVVVTLESLPALVAVQLVHAPTIALLWTAAISHLKHRAPPRAFATAQGLFSAATGAGAVIGMLTWGTLYQRVGGRGTFGMAAVVAAIAALLAFRWAVRARPPGESG